MKYLLIFFLLTAVGISQTFDRANAKNDGYSWVDSLWSVQSDSGALTMPDGSTAYHDTSKIYNIGKGYEWYEVTIIDTGTVIDDTLYIYLGTYLRNQAGTVIDTLWRQARLRDSSWTVVTQPLVDDDAVKTYGVYDPLLPAIDAIKIERPNEEWVAGRMTKLIHRLVKRNLR